MSVEGEGSGRKSEAGTGGGKGDGKGVASVMGTSESAKLRAGSKNGRRATVGESRASTGDCVRAVCAVASDSCEDRARARPEVEMALGRLLGPGSCVRRSDMGKAPCWRRRSVGRSSGTPWPARGVYPVLVYAVCPRPAGDCSGLPPLSIDVADAEVCAAAYSAKEWGWSAGGGSCAVAMVVAGGFAVVRGGWRPEEEEGA